MSNNNDEKPNYPVLRDYTEVGDLDNTSHEGNPKVVNPLRVLLVIEDLHSNEPILTLTYMYL